MASRRNSAELERLAEARTEQVPWRKWGPYLSERQWGTVRARSRVYRWGEDGLGGICDDQQMLCFALALWNGRDPILKERAFGLTNNEGNHGEDVKECYFYLDSTPTHSYVLVRISVSNRGPETASLQLLPTLWFRNTWSQASGGAKPFLKKMQFAGHAVVRAHHSDPLLREPLPDHFLYCDEDVPLLFTDNETNNERLFGKKNAPPYVKDAINNFVVHGNASAVNPAQEGTKVAAHYALTVGAGESRVIQLRLTTHAPARWSRPFSDFDGEFAARLNEADAYSMSPLPPRCSWSSAGQLALQLRAG